jgi:hypothetical protein
MEVELERRVRLVILSYLPDGFYNTSNPAYTSWLNIVGRVMMGVLCWLYALLFLGKDGILKSEFLI